MEIKINDNISFKYIYKYIYICLYTHSIVLLVNLIVLLVILQDYINPLSFEMFIVCKCVKNALQRIVYIKEV